MKALKYLDSHFEAIVISIGLVLISVLMMLQIILRNVFSSALPWVEEVCRYIFIWCSGFGISHATMKGSHLALDVLPTFVPKLKLPLEIFSDVVLFALCLYMIGPGYKAITMLLKAGQVSSALRIPMGYIYLSFLVGFIMSALRIVEKYIKKLMKRTGGNNE